jgi:hypothetical protein
MWGRVEASGSVEQKNSVGARQFFVRGQKTERVIKGLTTLKRFFLVLLPS